MNRIVISAVLLFSASASSSPAFFVANEGQWEGDFAYVCRVGSADYYVTPSGMTIDLREYERAQHAVPLQSERLGVGASHATPEPTSVRGHVLKLSYVHSPVGAPHAAPEIEGQNRLPSYSNYFLGRDKSRWRSRVGHYEAVVARQVWPGIDVEYHADSRGVETLFRVQPGADVGQIQIEYGGLEAPLSVDSKGRLVLQTSLGPIYEEAPFAFQREGRTQKAVPVSYCITGANSYSFTVPEADPERELVIDPLLYGSYLGSPDPDRASGITVDSQVRAVVCGRSRGPDFPTTEGAYQEEFPAPGGIGGGFVTKFNEVGDSLVFSTYVAAEGGTSELLEITMGSHDQIWCCGMTRSPQFPITENAVQDTLAGSDDVVLVGLSQDGTELDYGSYLGGIQFDKPRDILYDPVEGKLYFSGEASREFPTTEDAMFPEGWNNRGGFISVFDTQEETLAYSTLVPTWMTLRVLSLYLVEPGVVWIGGSIRGSGFLVTENAYQSENHAIDSVVHGNGFLGLWDLNQNQILYGSYFGGNGDVSIRDLIPMNGDTVLITGYADAGAAPTTPGALDTVPNPKSYLSLISLEQGLIASTLLGGNQGEGGGVGISLDSQGITAVGLTVSPDFPVTPGTFDSVLNGGIDLTISRLNLELSELIYSTYVGGVHDDGGGGITLRVGGSYGCAGRRCRVIFR